MELKEKKWVPKDSSRDLFIPYLVGGQPFGRFFPGYPKKGHIFFAGVASSKSII